MPSGFAPHPDSHVSGGTGAMTIPIHRPDWAKRVKTRSSRGSPASVANPPHAGTVGRRRSIANAGAAAARRSETPVRSPPGGRPTPRFRRPNSRLTRVNRPPQDFIFASPNRDGTDYSRTPVTSPKPAERSVESFPSEATRELFQRSQMTRIYFPVKYLNGTVFPTVQSVSCRYGHRGTPDGEAGSPPLSARQPVDAPQPSHTDTNDPSRRTALRMLRARRADETG